MTRIQTATVALLILALLGFFSAGQVMAREDPASQDTGVFCEVVDPTGLPITFVFSAIMINGQPADIGDVICIQDAGQDFLAVGSAEVPETGFPMPATAWEEDPAHGLPGAICGNLIAYQILDVSEGIAYDPCYIDYIDGDELFCPEPFTQVEIWFGTFEACFSADPTEGCAPLSVTFTNCSTGQSESCLWDFGDGTPPVEDCGPTVIHEYAEVGEYTVTLTMQTGPCNDVFVAENLVQVPGVAPVACFEHSPGHQPFEVVFTNCSTGDIDLCTWDFGDGTPPLESCDASVSHVYPGPGFYNASLTVADDVCGSDDDVQEVEVECTFLYHTTSESHEVAIIRVQVGDEDLQPGDEVAIYDGDLCVGASEFQGTYPLDIAAWIDDPETPELDGARCGWPIKFKVLLKDDCMMYPAIPLAYTARSVFCDESARRFLLDVPVDGGIRASDVVDQNPPQYELDLTCAYDRTGRTTGLVYSVPQESNVTLRIYDVTGRLLARPVEGFHDAGVYSTEWNGSRADGNRQSLGVFFAVLRVGDSQKTVKFVRW